MSVIRQDVGDRKTGELRVVVPGTDGLVLTVHHTVNGVRIAHFQHVAFNREGSSFLAADHLGHVYLFDLIKNSFKLVQQCKKACTSLVFTLHEPTEYIAALSDGCIACFNTETCRTVNWLRGHESPVMGISVDPSGRRAISTSEKTADLWDLESYQHLQRLGVMRDVGVQTVFFFPVGHTILSCFKDNSIFAWDGDSLSCKYQLPVPTNSPEVNYKCFAVSGNGQVLVAGGKSARLHVWSLERQSLVTRLQLPSDVRAVRHLDFLPQLFNNRNDEILIAFCQDKAVRFVHLKSRHVFLALAGGADLLEKTVVSPTGRHMVAVVASGAICVYETVALNENLQKPLAKVVQLTEVNLVKRTCSEKTQRGKRAGHRLAYAFGSLRNVEQCMIPEMLDRKRLVNFVKCFGEYPAKYRQLIWQSLLKLPQNNDIFRSLQNMETHHAFVELQKVYPLSSHKLHRVLKRILSALAHWMPLFEVLGYLPQFVLPFVKLFQNNHLLCFEIVATLMANWCQHWFECFPNPPEVILGMVEKVLRHHDEVLLQHFVSCQVTAQEYAWPLLETLFSEVLNQEEWLCLFDNVFSNEPAFLLMAVVAYLLCSHQRLMSIVDQKDFEYIFHSRSIMNVCVLVRKTYELLDGTPIEVHQGHMLQAFQPLGHQQHTLPNKLSNLWVNEANLKLERIRQEELKYLRHRESDQNLVVEGAKRSKTAKPFQEEQQVLRTGDQRCLGLGVEAQGHANQRTHLLPMKHDSPIEDLRMLDASSRQKLQDQDDLRDCEMAEKLGRSKVTSKELEAQRTDAEQKVEALALARNQLLDPLHEHRCEVSPESENDRPSQKPNLSCSVSLDRCRNMDGREQDLMQNVRSLRRRLVSQYLPSSSEA
uniref:TBC1 domain family member 31-like n=2 Tax=Myxine glutinosa TaxID=7769 RepID=UPI00358F1C90